MFGFRFSNTAKEPERLIPFTIGKGESPAHEKDELASSSENPGRIRPAFLDARFARLKRNQPLLEISDTDEDSIDRFQNEDESELHEFEEQEEFEPEQDESQDYETNTWENSFEDDEEEHDFEESASPRLVQYSSRLGALTPRGNSLRFQIIDRLRAVEPQSTLINFSAIEDEEEDEEEESFDSIDALSDTVEFNLQSDSDGIDADEVEEVILAPVKPVAIEKVEKISYQPKPLITRLIKQRSKQAQLDRAAKPDQPISPFSPSPGLGQTAFGSSGIKPVAEVAHKWPSLPKSFASDDFRSSTSRSSASTEYSASSTDAITPQRQVSIKDYTGAPNFMRGQEVQRAASSAASESVDIKAWSEKLDSLLNHSSTEKILNQNQSSVLKKDNGSSPYAWKTGF